MDSMKTTKNVVAANTYIFEGRTLLIICRNFVFVSGCLSHIFCALHLFAMFFIVFERAHTAGMIAAPRSGGVGASTPPTSTDERSLIRGHEPGIPSRMRLGLIWQLLNKWPHRGDVCTHCFLITLRGILDAMQISGVLIVFL